MPIVILGFLPDGRRVSLEGKILPKKKEKDFIQMTIWDFLPVVKMAISSYVVPVSEPKAEAPKNPNRPRRKLYTPISIWDFM